MAEPPQTQEVTGTTTRVPYRIKANNIEACNCRHGCNCQFGGFPNEEKCEFLIGLDVTEGRYGDIDLADVRAVLAMKFPNAIHEGNGEAVLFVDESASSEQADALRSIISGESGGMPWEALGGTFDSLEGPVLQPIEMILDGRRSRFQIPGILEAALTPLRNPVTDEVNDVQIVYPSGGFTWDGADIATTRTMRIDYNGFNFEYPDRYAAFAPVEWTNQEESQT